MHNEEIFYRFSFTGDAMNAQLTATVSVEEIRQTTLDIDGDKAPYPDGMTDHFYHQF